MSLTLFITVPRGVEPVLSEELRHLGALNAQATRGGISCTGSLEFAYRVCLWSRVASRVLLQLRDFIAASPDELYSGIQAINWDDHLSVSGSLAIDVSASESRIKHTHFAALKVKDAIVDQFRERTGQRPSVDLLRPDVRINVNIHKNQARVSLDLAGEGLHRRGYRAASVLAPLRENLAAAILLQAGWPAMAEAGLPLIDPMCGSGTFPIEAAWMARDVAPGLLREQLGFERWRGHDHALWDALISEAMERRTAAQTRRVSIFGYDVDRTAVRAALQNVERAGLTGQIHIERRSLSAAEPVGDRGGLLIVNPPYGERLGADSDLPKLYSELGSVGRQRFGGWSLALFTGNSSLVHRLRLPATKRWDANNGKLPCSLLQWSLPQASPDRGHDGGQPVAAPSAVQQHDVAVEMFANRLRKNWQHLARWARRNDIYCFRAYDADLPEYALAVDYYSGAGQWVLVQEYRAPATVDPEKAKARLEAALAVVPEILPVPAANVYCKVRERQKGKAQYEKLSQLAHFETVREGNCSFLVNFTDYLDTGLFLDHRPLRQRLQDLAPGKRFLNLFAYTGTATVAAAVGGAAATTSVDLSRTYLDWTRQNLILNKSDLALHRLVHADCCEWLTAPDNVGHEYDLILFDPPTFSNSKRMDGTFDVQRDHGEMLRAAVRLLAPLGELYFSTNRQRFQLDRDALHDCKVTDITAQTLPQDFSRHGRIHQCWRITKC